MRFSLPNSTNLPVFVAKCIFRDIIFFIPHPPFLATRAAVEPWVMLGTCHH